MGITSSALAGQDWGQVCSERGWPGPGVRGHKRVQSRDRTLSASGSSPAPPVSSQVPGRSSQTRITPFKQVNPLVCGRGCGPAACGGAPRRPWQACLWSGRERWRLAGQVRQCGPGPGRAGALAGPREFVRAHAVSSSGQAPSRHGAGVLRGPSSVTNGAPVNTGRQGYWEPLCSWSFHPLKHRFSREKA